MIGILIIAHERLGESLIECATHMLGERPKQLHALAVKSNDEPDILLQQAQAIADEIDSGDGVLVLSDIYGGTPCNIATKLVSSSHTQGISGLNLPMLIVALSYRNLPFDDCLNKAMNSGQESVVYFNEKGCMPS
jgi:PTS system ascorbate-specific IIA component